MCYQCGTCNEIPLNTCGLSVVCTRTNCLVFTNSLSFANVYTVSHEAHACSNHLCRICVLSVPLLAMFVALSDAIGCPLEFIIFPLLTIVAGCMGINAHISINEMWNEPSVIWFIVAANKDQKKTAALRLLKTTGRD